ncbi:hypothetical protein [Flavobacterium aciduliphilum]|uniref:NlpE-like protein n=1 Tax=Flavobacterium aciduliphilum TaxID=1101402 RepID=A0A328YIQ3_9FLAO|nr:hypothetical protein [Flavobacterium aciduliphilum]RAR72615.1 hypothetical protein CLV55_105185 [Flavobacterium aciduliphilum]
MKKIFCFLFLLNSLCFWAQTDCDYAVNTKDSLGIYKATQDYVVHERIFGNTQTSIFFSLINADGVLSLNFQLLQKSKDFVPAHCFDKNSKIYLQLNNGKIVTLVGISQESCGNNLRTNEGNNRLLTGYFLFKKDTFEHLKNCPITMIRVLYSGEQIDYVMKDTLVSEVDKKTYHPDHFFMDYLKCVE